MRRAGQPRHHGRAHLADERGWLATFILDESLRDDAAPAVARLQQRGLGVQLLSGDRTRAVRRLAWRAGIDRSWGRQSPEDKLEHVRSQQAEGRRVAMVGDGLNDGPVLARADVSFAMGQGAPLAQSRSDFVVLGGQLDAIARSAGAGPPHAPHRAPEPGLGGRLQRRVRAARAGRLDAALAGRAGHGRQLAAGGRQFGAPGGGGALARQPGKRSPPNFPGGGGCQPALAPNP